MTTKLCIPQARKMTYYIIVIFNLYVISSTHAFEFEPLKQSASPDDYNASKPFILPVGYSQEIVSDENDLNIYPTNDWNDMLTLNETGIDAGRYLYRTHEVRPRNFSDSYPGGAVSVIDLKTQKAKVLVQRKDWEAIDGIVWTPWKSLLVAEEIQKSRYPDPNFPNANRGHVYEIFLDPIDKSKAVNVVIREQLGALAHEGIEIDELGNVYLVDEDYEGSIYKFVPEIASDLSKGQLFALKIKRKNEDRTGIAEWVALNKSIATNNANIAANKAKATTWCRPEDLERIKQHLYVALTCFKNSIRGQRRENRVLSISLDGNPVVKDFVREFINAPEEINKHPLGFAKPDNLANGPDDTLWIVEDNSPSDIWVAYPDKNGDGYADKVELFASLTDLKAEATGIYFDKDFNNLYVNIQHSVSGNDKTLKIYKTKK